MSAEARPARWRLRGSAALVAVVLGFVIYPLIEGRNDVINSDWSVFATGARLIVEDPGQLYNFDVQRHTQFEVTGGRTLISPGVNGLLPFLAPAWVALFALPFEALGTDLGGRLWILFGLACLALGLILAVRPRPRAAMLPAFASVPTALLLLNAQLDGLVALGIGGAIAVWTRPAGRRDGALRPFLAGLCLGLTLVKPQLVLLLAAALVLVKEWRVLAGWAAAGTMLFAAAAVFNPRWVLDWVPALGAAVQPGVREIDLAHLGTMLPDAYQRYAVALLSLLALIGALALARLRRQDPRAAAAVLVAGGVLVAPHALPPDLVLVAVGLAIWGKATWADWLVLSVGAMIAAVVPAPLPAAVGVLIVGWLCLRVVGLSAWRPGRARASAG